MVKYSCEPPPSSGVAKENNGGPALAVRACPTLRRTAARKSVRASRHQARPGQKALGRGGNLEAELAEELNLEQRLELAADFSFAHRWRPGFSLFVGVPRQHQVPRARPRQAFERVDESRLIDPASRVITAAIEQEIEG